MFTQSRFLSTDDIGPEDDATVWPVPLAIVCFDGGKDAFLTKKQDSIGGVDFDFYKVNSRGIGFYRVTYPPARLKKLGRQQDRLDSEDKISIIGSTAALAFARLDGTSPLLAFLQGFRQEAEFVDWQHSGTSLTRLRLCSQRTNKLGQVYNFLL